MKKGLVFELLFLLIVLVAFILLMRATRQIEDDVALLGEVGGRARQLVSLQDESERALLSVDAAARRSLWDSLYDVSSTTCKDTCYGSLPERTSSLTNAFNRNLNSQLNNLDLNLPQDNYEYIVEYNESIRVHGIAKEPMIITMTALDEYVRTPINSYLGLRLYTEWQISPGGLRVGEYYFHPSFTVDVPAPDLRDEINKAVEESKSCTRVECEGWEEKMKACAERKLKAELPAAQISWTGNKTAITLQWAQAPPWRRTPPTLYATYDYEKTDDCLKAQA